MIARIAIHMPTMGGCVKLAIIVLMVLGVLASCFDDIPPHSTEW